VGVARETEREHAAAYDDKRERGGERLW